VARQIVAQATGARRVPWSWLAAGLLALAAAAFAPEALAHGVSENDRAFIQGSTGVHIAPYIYLGAKHMLTGYDHLLFLVGVIFFLYRLKDVVHYVTLFAIGHSCDCGHAECDDRVKTGAAIHEQAR